MSWREKYAPRLVTDDAGKLVEVDFAGYHCQLLLDRYREGGLCLRLVNMDEFDRIAIATACLPDDPPPPGCIYIKDYSENQGMLQTLCHAGVITDTGERVSTGYTELAIARLAPRIEQQFQNWLQSGEITR
jgi:hypothetical protein